MKSFRFFFTFAGILKLLETQHVGKFIVKNIVCMKKN